MVAMRQQILSVLQLKRCEKATENSEFLGYELVVYVY